MKKLRERVDTYPFTVKPMSHNMPGHKERMKAICERVQKEYLDFRDENGRFKRPT